MRTDPRQIKLSCPSRRESEAMNRPALVVSRPKLQDGRVHVKALIKVGRDDVRINASAPVGMLMRARPYLQFQNYDSFAGTDDELGCCAGEEDFGGIFDSIVSITKQVVDNPAIKMAASMVPGGGAVVEGASLAANLYTSAKAGQKKARRQIRRIRVDARRGVPDARKAAAALRAVKRADIIRRAAKRGNPKALFNLRRLAQGLTNRDPSALEAAALFEALEVKSPTATPAPPPPVVVDYRADEQEPEDAVEEIVGAVMQRATLTPRDRRALAMLNRVFQRVRARPVTQRLGY